MAKKSRGSDGVGGAANSGDASGASSSTPSFPVDVVWAAGFKSQLLQALATFDRSSVEKLVRAYVERVRTSGASLGVGDVESLLGQLRRHRHFRLMCEMADVWLQASGWTGAATFRIRRQYVQGLIDGGNVTAGLSLAEDLRDAIEATKPDHKEWAETCGLIGRCHKQAYVESGRPDRLRQAIAAYWQVYERNRQSNYWHGINVVALLARAEADHLRFPEFSEYYPDLAREILGEIQSREESQSSDAWARATAAEACVALHRPEEAVQWAVLYVHSDYSDAFELASTIRQLTEVWRLTKQSGPGAVLLPLLEAELLKRQGGSLRLDSKTLAAAAVHESASPPNLEKVFGADSYRTWQWYRRGLDCGRAIARLETKTRQGQGTGFLVRARDLNPQARDELLLLTNAHVLSEDPKVSPALRQSQAYVRFEGAEDGGSQTYRVSQILATSPPGEFDFTLARLDPQPPHREGLTISTTAPNPSSQSRLYAIGYPLGGGLSISLHDNEMIDFESPKVHYRTPTDPGSSGSPIFDDQWNLVALHHAGSRQMPRLRGEPGTYEANEGIWITRIIDSVSRQMNGAAGGGSTANSGEQKSVTPPAVGLQAAIDPSPSSPPTSPSTTAASLSRSTASSSSSLPSSRSSASRGPVMPTSDILSNLKQFMRQVTPEERLESLRRDMPWESTAGKLESVGEIEIEPTPEAAASALEKIAMGRDLDPVEQTSLEAIVLPRERPVVFIEDGTFGEPESPWEHFGTDRKLRQNIERAIQSIGRVELPTNPSIPFGGTAFVVGENLLMTNRHVAELFAVGLGRQVRFRQNYKAGWDYLRERRSGKDTSTMLEVRKVRMIHPYWDMALLEVVGLKPEHKPLRLSVAAPESLVDRDVAVIGYPAKDWRNNTEMQDRIFKRTYNVKRLQPGKIRQRDKIESFSHVVSALTHDSSTLGGNSGSAVVDAATGDVIGLHFAGLYLKANYAVPTYELARDSQVVDAGVNFGGTVRADTTMRTVWRGVEATAPSDLVDRGEPTDRTTDGTSAGTTKIELRLTAGGNSLSIPITVSASLSAGKRNESPGAHAEFLESLRAPKIFTSLDTREGYDPSFLVADGGVEVPLPELTEAGRKVVAKLDNGSHVLKYHKFSVVMHKIRRLALFTAANVDWRDEMRKINGRKPSRDELTELGPNDREMWVMDERIPGNQQLPDVFFSRDGGNFDKGHLVRRDDVAWGESFEDMQMGNGDTYHTTNCSPQVAGFNQSAQGKDNWGDLENMVQRESRSERVIVFSGPVLSPKDDRFEGRDLRGAVRIQIPRSFWKIIVANGENGPQAFGFVLEQDLSNVPVEFAVPTAWRSMMRKISEIEKLLFGLVSLDWLKRHDVRR